MKNTVEEMQEFLLQEFVPRFGYQDDGEDCYTNLLKAILREINPKIDMKKLKDKINSYD